MMVKVGCDLVQISRFKRSADNTGKEFLDRIFLASELAQMPAVATLAGMFAAKEAVIKALEMKAGDWHKIEIVKIGSGRPEARVTDFSQRIVSHDLSISHDGEYVMAIAVFLISISQDV